MNDERGSCLLPIVVFFIFLFYDDLFTPSTCTRIFPHISANTHETSVYVTGYVQYINTFLRRYLYYILCS